MSLWEETDLCLSLLTLIQEKKQEQVCFFEPLLAALPCYSSLIWRGGRSLQYPRDLAHTQPMQFASGAEVFSPTWFNFLLVLVPSDPLCWDAFLLLYLGSQVWVGGHCPALKDISSDGAGLMCWMGRKSSESFTSNTAVLVYLSSNNFGVWTPQWKLAFPQCWWKCGRADAKSRY